ncbi:MAG: hypothetical protein ACLTLQ_01850 [[Clostridium] scindens]
MKADSDGQAQKGRTYPAHSLFKKRRVSGDPSQQSGSEMQQVPKALGKALRKSRAAAKMVQAVTLI